MTRAVLPNMSMPSDLEDQLTQQLVRQIQAEEDAQIMRLLNNLCVHSRDVRMCDEPECQVRAIHES